MIQLIIIDNIITKIMKTNKVSIKNLNFRFFRFSKGF